MRWKPKDWPARKARRTREEHAWEASDLAEPIWQLVIKDIWTDGRQRPAWAKLAHARGWMTSAAYYALPMSEKTQGFLDFLYEKMLPKTSDWPSYGKVAAG